MLSLSFSSPQSYALFLIEMPLRSEFYHPRSIHCQSYMVERQGNQLKSTPQIIPDITSSNRQTIQQQEYTNLSRCVFSSLSAYLLLEVCHKEKTPPVSAHSLHSYLKQLRPFPSLFNGSIIILAGMSGPISGIISSMVSNHSSIYDGASSQ